MAADFPTHKTSDACGHLSHYQQIITFVDIDSAFTQLIHLQSITSNAEIWEVNSNFSY